MRIGLRTTDMRLIASHALTALLCLALLAHTAFAGHKYVILTAPYGSGHNTAAKRVAEAILKEQPDAEIKIMDMQNYMPESVKKLTTWGFNTAQGKLPKAYTYGFKRYMKKGEKVDHVGEMPMADTFALRMKEFVTAIDAEHPDAIIATWHHAIEPIANARRNGYLKDIPLSWVHTDNVSNGGETKAYYEKVADEVDQAFMPSEAVAKAFISAGVPASKITVSGMPIKVVHRPQLSQEELQARRIEARKRVGLDPSRRAFMIEAGKNGIGNYPAMIGSIVETFPGEPISVIAATGDNPEQLEQVKWLIEGVGTDAKKSATLYSRLKILKKHGTSEETIRGWIRNGLTKDKVDVRPLAFVPLEDWRMAANADGTKPGGLSTAEMAAEGTPMVLRAGLASGQELHNIEYFVNEDHAVEAPDETAIGPLMKKIADDPAFLVRLEASSEQYRKSIRTEEIAKWAVHAAETHALLAPSQVRKDPTKYPGLAQGCLRRLVGIMF